MTLETRKPFTKEKLRQFQEITNVFPKTELAFLGERIPVMYAGWGNYLTTEEMISQWSIQETPQILKDAIRSYGVSGGYFYGNDHDPSTPEAHEQSIIHMTAMAEGLMKLRGWVHADLRLATISEHPDIAQEVVKRLEDKGLHIDGVKTYGLACDGGGAAMIDAIADPEANGRQMVFVAAENLSGKSVPRENLAMSTLFGNGGGGTAFIPGEELSLVHQDLVQAYVEKDVRGVIEVPRVYQVDMLRQDHTPIQLPYWYEVKEGANFLFSDDVIANEMTTSGNTGNMKIETGPVFTQLVEPRVRKLLDKYYDLFHEEENIIRLAILHQPSKIIIEHIARKLKKHFGERCPEIPWFMQDTGFNNISSGNIFIAMTEAAKRNLLHPGEVFFFGSFGIGLSAHMAVVQLNI
ncbi:MAG: 3-oxoacyl-[acyl-carrier-protein] synthase III C-terminal domain-containing protein [Patescibacteria group bacterium]